MKIVASNPTKRYLYVEHRGYVSTLKLNHKFSILDKEYHALPKVKNVNEVKQLLEEKASRLEEMILEESLGLYAPFDLEIDDYLFENT